MNLPQLKTAITVSTGSRLHFGLTRVKPDEDMIGGNNRINGVGIMINSPKTKLLIEPDSRFHTTGSERLEQFAQAWSTKVRQPLPSCRLQLLESPPEHSGFGSGTQLACAVASGLAAFLGVKNPTAELMAESLSRGKRSMIGTLGFLTGGLVVDKPAESNAKFDVTEFDPLTELDECPVNLAARIRIPTNWRVVLLLDRSVDRKFGVQEQSAFDNIQAQHEVRSRRLENLIVENLLPAISENNFRLFADTVHEYGRLSGEYYTKVQGGVFNGPSLQNMVRELCEMGAQGVGQSSWGPVLFSWCPNGQSATELVEKIRQHFGERIESWIASPRNSPALIRRSPASTGQTSTKQASKSNS